MAELLLCNQQIRSDDFENQCGVPAAGITGFNCGVNPISLQPYQPYLLEPSPSIFERNVMMQLATSGNAQNLTHLALSHGEDNTLALADITAKLREYGIGTLDSSTAVYGHRVGGFGLAVKKYQDALMEYRTAITNNPATRAMARQKVLSAFQQMQERFRHELTTVSIASKARKSTPLNSTTRALNIARSSRNVAKLNVTSQVQASNLVNYSRYAKVLGSGLAVIDFGTRVGNIKNSYNAGGNWERDMFIESSSFALSAGAGTAMVSAGGAVLTFLTVATPIGCVGLIIGGVAVAGAAAGTAIGMNNAVKNNSGGWYDGIMAWIQGK